MIFQNALAHIKDDDNPRLHRVPFTIMWVVSYALAWFAISFASMIAYDMRDMAIIGDTLRWITNHAEWMNGIGLGLTFGLMLSLVQTWLIRRRYGFVPRLWRYATIIGATITGLSFPFATYYWDYNELWIPMIIWFSLLNIFQAGVMFRVNHQAWLLALVGIVAGLVAGTLQALPDFYDAEIWSLLLGATIQAVGTAIVMLRLMANPREGIVPKRDSDEKSKTPMRDGLHPMTFIALWAAAHFAGWVMFAIVVVVLMMTIGETEFGYEISNWLEFNAEWVIGLTFGAIVGITSAIAQPWLMKQHSKVEVKHWLVLSTIGWAIAGIGFWNYIEGYNFGTIEKALTLMVWFATPTFFQTIPMWRAMRGGWIWAGTGFASAIIALLLDTQLAWTYNDTFYAIMLGGLAQAIITGSTFILLQSQQRRVEPDTVSA